MSDASYDAVAHGRGEVAGFLSDARDRFAPSMRQRLDVAGVYADAVYEVAAGEDASGPARALPQVCPYRLEQLLAARADVAELVAHLGEMTSHNDSVTAVRP